VSFIDHARPSAAGGAFVLLVLVLSASELRAQAQRPLAWLQDLTDLQNASAASLGEQRDVIVAIRTEVENWLKLHANSSIKLAPAPPQPWSAEQTRSQVSLLRETVEAILKEDPDQPFHLGVTEITVTAAMSPLSPVADSIDQTEIKNRDAVTVAKALDFLPGVAIDHISTNRNEAGIRVRGFSTRGQVPLYLDGIPVYVPYDGYVDFNRFLTSDIAEVQVARGYSSPLLGPNALGGSINLVTKEPVKKLEGDALIGTGSGNRLLSSLHLGSRWRHFLVQGSIDWLQRDFIPLSGDFPLNQYQPTFERNQSYSRDEKYSGRAAWTPKGQDEYVFSYVNQKGEKGVPLYAGPNSNATFRNFWKWPYWNKTSYYFISNTGVGERSSIRFRVYYDQFRNSIDMYDDATYTTMKKSTSLHSQYDDHSDGASSEFSTRVFPRNLISASFFFKDDTHRDYSIYPGRSPYPFATPDLVDRAQQTSIGFQDAITLSSRLNATVGFSVDHLDGLQAQAYNSSQTGLLPVKCIAAPNNASFSGCTAHIWNYNPQASVSYILTRTDTLFITFADRGRFPLLKESYSYSLGKGLPNPDLKPEHSRNWNIGYAHSFAARTLVQIEVFRSSLRDAIELVYIKDPGSLCSNTGAFAGYCSQNVNLGSEIHSGVEFNMRSTRFSRLTLDANYSYLNRTLTYDFASFPRVSQVNTSIQILPTLPKNKLVGSATVQLPHQALAIATVRYEGGIALQDTTYNPAPQPYGESFSTMDFGAVVPIRAHMTVQAGVKNLFDRNYCYTAGYPEEGRNWFFNLRFRF
jgi:iron complex outermembrane receptor protein